MQSANGLPRTFNVQLLQENSNVQLLPRTSSVRSPFLLRRLQTDVNAPYFDLAGPTSTPSTFRLSKSTLPSSPEYNEEPEFRAQEARNESLLSLLGSGRFSDCTIKCKDKIWTTHRFVLCQQSAYFRGALEGRFKEAREGVLDLSSEDEQIVMLMINWLYGGRDAIEKLTAEDEDLDLLYPAPLYALARRLDLVNLAVDLIWDFGHNARKKCLDTELDRTFRGLATEVEHVYDGTPSTDRKLRDQLVRQAVFLVNKAKTEEHRKGLEEAFEASGAFAREVLWKFKE